MTARRREPPAPMEAVFSLGRYLGNLVADGEALAPNDSCCQASRSEEFDAQARDEGPTKSGKSH